MTGKLFPPFIETKLPAFAEVINIEFDMNRAVGLNTDVSAMSLLVKTAQTGKTLGTVLSSGKPVYNSKTGKNQVSFGDLSKLNLLIGQYYKVQLAYVNKQGDVGYYSSAGIIKKTTLPTLSIPSLDKSLSNIHDYTGVYSQKTVDEVVKDATEKIYSYSFSIYDSENKLVDTSGELLHNSDNDTLEYESICTWRPNVDLIKEKYYHTIFKVTTINGLTHSTSRIVYVEESVDIDIDIDLLSELNYEDGTIKLSIQPNNFKPVTITGDFILSRSSSASDFKQWDQVYNFHYLNIIIGAEKPTFLWEDYSIVQGEEYLYSLQAYNIHGLYSNRKEAKGGKVKADFEHCFLSDANRQLKISLNPKVSSIKNTVLESKMDTLGSKYPFIFRNGYVNYKEFPISGLLSLLTDENEKFMSFNRDELRENRIATPGFGKGRRLTTDLTSENIYNERIYKMEVLDWLNNGQPKIFRSATEGNYIVRLMNSSLTPNDTLGRMLHTFNSTAYEVADWNFNNLKSFSLIDVPTEKKSILKVGQVEAIKVIDADNDGTLAGKYPGFTVSANQKRINTPHAYSVIISEAKPGSMFNLYISGRANPANIEIGGTGTYEMQIGQSPNENDDTYLTAIEAINSLEEWNGVKITYEYYDSRAFDTFGQINDLESLHEIRRYVGYDYNINIIKPSIIGDHTNVLADIRRDIGVFNFIRVEKRYTQEVWERADGKYARNQSGSDIIDDDEWNDVIIYHVNNGSYAGRYFSGKVDIEHRMSGTPDYRFCLNSNVTDFSDFTGREVGGPDPENPDSPYTQSFGKIDAIRNVDVETLRVGNGLILDIAYRVRVKVYAVEEKVDAVNDAKIMWQQRQTELNELFAGITYTFVGRVSKNNYNKSKHYYYDEISKKYVRNATQWVEDRDYYTRKSGVNPTKAKVEEANKAVHEAYKVYINELSIALENQ